MTPVSLHGLRAENPLAFLAALGTLSLLDETLDEPPRLSWQGNGATWTPAVHGDRLDAPDDVLSALADANAQRDLTEELGWEKDIMKITREELRNLLAARAIGSESVRLLTACVAELPTRRGEDTYYTPFRLMPRVGRARFLDTALRESRDGIDHLQSCLFENWRYRPDTQSMRWDPASLVPSRALMGEAPTHVKPHGVPGAILLAVRGLASFPLVTQLRDARPPGMADRRRFVWPIWRDPLRLSVVRMVLSMRWLYELDGDERSDSPKQAGNDIKSDSVRRGVRRPRPDPEAQLRAHGVVATFTASRNRRGDDDEAFGWGVPRIIDETAP